MMKMNLNTISPRAQALGAPAVVESGPEQMLMKLLGQGKLTSEEKGILDFSEGNQNFAELLGKDILNPEKKEISSIESTLAKLSQKNFDQTGLNISEEGHLNKEGQETKVGFDKITNIENKETHKKTQSTQADQTLSKLLTTSPKGETAKIAPTPQAEGQVLQAELSSSKVANKDLSKIDTQNKMPNILGEGNSNLLIEQQAPKVNNKSALKQFSKEQNSLGGNLLKFKRDVKDEEVNKSELKAEAVKDQWVDQMGQKNEAKFGPTTTGTTKTHTLDLSNVDVSNKTELMAKITSYIEQNAIKIDNGNGLDLKVKHEELGDIKITVQKSAQGDSINLNMTTDSPEASKFIKNNEAELTNTLSQSGIKLGDFKVVTSSDAMAKLDQSSDFNSNRDSKQPAEGQSKFAGARDDQGRERRKDLWERMSDQRAA